MKRIFHPFRSIPLLMLPLLFFSCTDYDAEDQKHRNEERTLMEPRMEGRSVGLYKGVKLLVRAVPMDIELPGDSLHLDEAVEEMPYDFMRGSKAANILERFLGEETVEEGANTFIQAWEYLSLAAEVLSESEELEFYEEDDYPTMLHSMANIYHTMDDSAIAPKDITWSKPMEHLALATMLSKIEYLPESIGLYELNAAKVNEMPDDERKVIAALMQGMLFESEGYHFLADSVYGHAVDLSGGQLGLNGAGYGDLMGTGNDQTFLQELHGLSYFMRWYSRKNSAVDYKMEQGSEDLNQFIHISEQNHFDNELTWFAGAIYYTEQEEHDKAALYLQKLEASPYMSNSVKAVFTEVKDYVEGRSTNDVLHKLTDTYFIIEFAGGQLMNVVKESDWHREVDQSKAGQRLLHFPEWISSEYEMIQSVTDVKQDVMQQLESLETTIANEFSAWTDSLGIPGLTGDLDSILIEGSELLNEVEDLLDFFSN